MEKQTIKGPAIVIWQHSEVTKLAPIWLPSHSGALLADPRNCGNLEAKLTTTNDLRYLRRV